MPDLSGRVSEQTSILPIQLDEAGVVFDHRYALYRISLAFEPGTATVVVGENGAGKSTLLSLLAGRLKLQSGRLERNESMIGYLGHELMLYEDLTGMENLVFFARLWRHKLSTEQLESIMHAVGLADAGNKRVRAYSRGMKQRLAVSKLMVSKSRIWLMDEPTTGLDARGRKWLFQVINDAVSRGITVITASHIPAFVQAVAGRVVVLRQGRVVKTLSRGDTFVEQAFKLSEGDE